MQSVKAVTATDLSPRRSGVSPSAARSSDLLRAAWFYLLQLASLAIFFGAGLFVTLCVVPLSRLLARRSSPAHGQEVVHRLFAIFTWWLQMTGLFRIEFCGLDKLWSLRGVIIAPNHPGLLDAVFVISRMPRVVCVMRAGIMRNPCLGGAARMAGYIGNDVGPGLIRNARKKIHSGENLLIFPEGTRTRLDARGVNNLKHGFALIAKVTGAPIQTVLIERSGDYLAKEVGLLRPARIPIRVTLSLGSVFHARPDESAKELAARLEAYYRSRIENSVEGVFLKNVSC